MEEPVAYFKGRFTSISKAVVSIQSKALNYGLGCFEGIRAYWTPEDEQLRIFRVDDHYARLFHSCRILQLRLDMSVEAMVEATVELCRRNAYRSDVYIRPIVWCDSPKLSPIMTEEDIAFAIYGLPLRDYLDTTKGITACVSSWRRVQDNMIPARAKPTAAYLNSALARYEAKANGCDEAILLTHDGYVSEGSAEHVFIVRDGVLITPTTQDDNLDGITRKTLIELARAELKREVIERRVSRTELYVADEVFFCGTGAEVTPVVEIDRRPVNGGEPGPVTRELQAVFFKAVKGRLPGYARWCRPVYDR